ncbi:MAG TPA: protein-glutamate O-methyltransferase CheR [Polyangiaceae bacterium]|nr:protein-glutamate O-methyltransferase CheR [Polyangiaceae bacterium]
MTGFALSPPVFAILSALIEERTGIHYGSEDRALLAEKLEPRVAERGFDSLLDYYYFLRYDAAADAEFSELVEALVVNETYFFRETAALETIVSTFLPELVRAGVRPRVWCAACATGEEPFTLAMLLDAAGLLDSVTLVASDISTRALRHARERRYFRRSLRALPRDVVGRWLVPVENGMCVERRIADAVEFRRVNLTDQASVAELGQFDVVLCRNVLIYFSDATVETVVATLARALRPNGRLIVGASESLLRFETGLACEERSGAFFYRKGET